MLPTDLSNNDGQSPSATESLQGPPNDVTPNKPTQGEIMLSERATAEDTALAEALAALNLTPEEVRLAVEAKKIHTNHFANSINIIGGSMTRTCILVQTQLTKIEERLADVRAMISNELASTKTDGTRSDRNRLAMEEKQLSESYMALATSLRKMMETSQRAAALQVMARYR